MTSKQLKEHRSGLGITQTQMAVNLCVSRIAYHRWENGNKIPLSIQKLYCLMYGVPFKNPKTSKANKESPDLPFK